MRTRAIALGLAMVLGGSLVGCGGEEGGGGGEAIPEDKGAIEQRNDTEDRGTIRQPGMNDDDHEENEGTERRGSDTND